MTVNLSPDIKPTSGPELPAPWEHVGQVFDALRDALELSAGSPIAPEDLTPEERAREVDTVRSIQAQDLRWVALRDRDHDVLVYVRLQGQDQPEKPLVRVSAVVVPFHPEHDLTGTILRNLPVQAIGVAYATHEAEGRANMMRLIALGEGVNDEPLAPLPPASADDAFTARAARQYVAIEEQYPGVNPITKMMVINDAKRSSVQRWITRARKRGLLPPAVRGRRRG